MSDVTLKIPVGAAEQVSQIGEYIAVKSSNVPLDIHIQGVGTMKMGKGEVWRVRGSFDGFSVENYGSVNGDVLLAVGFGDYSPALSVGNLDTINTITNPVTVNQHDVGKIINPVDVINNVIGYPSFFNKYYGAGINPIEIVPPALNVNGIILDHVSVQSAAGATAAFMSKSSIPTNGAAASHLDVSARCYGRVTSGWTCPSVDNKPFFIPAGLGLYFSTNAPAMCYCEYEVL